MLESTEKISHLLDLGSPVDIIYLDFQKAFDKVPHERLQIKLQNHCIGGEVLKWIGNWLRNRKQRVVINSESSRWSNVTSGVPQGSVLGPTLFTIYINDIDDDLLNTVKKFADDTKLIGEVDTDEQIRSVKEDLLRLEKWAEQWQIQFNADKCKVMHLGAKNKGSKYEIGGKECAVVEEEKDLGVIFDNTFKAGNQCLKAAKKGNQILGMIGRTFTCKNKKVMLSLYKSLVRPHLEQNIQAWRPHLIKDRKVLEKVQRRATRMIPNCKGMNYDERLQFVGLTNLETRRERADMIEVYKIINKLEGLQEKDFFVRDIGNRRGHSFKLFMKRCRIDVARYSFGNRTCIPWNRLPQEVVSASSINIFKNRIDHYLRYNWGFN